MNIPPGHTSRFRQLLIINDASSKGLLALVFPTLTGPGFARDFDSTLTATSLYRSGSGWFETCS